MNGTLITRYKDTIFIPLPSELWREIEGGCACEYCSDDGKSQSPAYWDTLAVSAEPPKDHYRADYAYTVHHPGLHRAKPKAKKTA